MKLEKLSTLKMDNLTSTDGYYYQANTSLAVGKPFFRKVLPTPLPKIFAVASSDFFTGKLFTEN